MVQLPRNPTILARAAIPVLLLATNLTTFESAGTANLGSVQPRTPAASAPAGISGTESTSGVPKRVLDTREGLGAPRGQSRPGTTIVLALPSASQAGATSVTLNVTATESTGSGWAAVWPCGQPTPKTSNLNFVSGQSVANLVMVGLGNGAVCLTTSAPVHLVADLMGWFTNSADFRPAAPTRLLDTRDSGSRLQAGETRVVSLIGGDGRVGSARAVALNITAVSPSRDGFIVVFPCGPRPLASTVNFRAGEIVPNFTLVPFTRDEVCVFASATTDLVVDSFGWSDSAAGLRVQAPSRVLDTRSRVGWTGAVNSADVIELRVAGRGSVPLNASSVLLTVTATEGTADGFVTIWPCDQPRPLASILNLRPGLLRSNVALVDLSDVTGSVCIWTNTFGSSRVHIVADAIGWTPGGPDRAAPSIAVRGGGMPLISRSIPAFVSSAVSPSDGADAARDSSTGTLWQPATSPAWIAFDTSSLPSASRQGVLVALYAEKAADYNNTGIVDDWQRMPVDYTVESNSAPGGGSPPAAGWTVLKTVTNNDLAAPQHLVQLGGANWLRVRITKSGGPSGVALDVDVYSAPNGATDGWLFTGDSITAITFGRCCQGTQLAQRVNNLNPERWPAHIGAGIGGTSTVTALDTIDARLASFPGRYVVLGYGTNDTPGNFMMEALVQKVIAAGKTPVIPRVPWSNAKFDVPQLNALIDALYIKYPQVLPGPDLYGLTLNRFDYISSGDVHPTDSGRQAILNAYAAMM